MVNREALVRCEQIISLYMALRNPSPELTDRFQEWLTEERHCTEKNIIMRRKFYEILNEQPSMRWKEE